MKIRKIRRLIVIGCIALSTSLLASFALYEPVKSTRSVAVQPTINVQSHSANSDRIASTISAVSTLSTDHLLDCLPDDATNIRKIASQETTEQARGVTHELSYHYFTYYRRQGHREAVILDFKGICGLAYDSDLGLAMSEMVPMAVARSLVLQDYQASAEAVGGVEVLKQSIMEGLAPPPSGILPRFTPERIWALAQLGIHPPEDKYTVKEITPYVPGQFTR